MPETTPVRLMRRHLAVVHPTRPELLVQRGEDGALRLPFLDEPNGDPRVVGGMAAHLAPGLVLTSLGELASVWLPDGPAGGVVSEYLMLCELYPAPAAPALEGLEWLGAARAAEVVLGSELAAALGDLFAWLADEPAEGADSPFGKLPPHAQPGATAALGELVRGLAGARQLQSWVLSSVWLTENTVIKVTCPLWPQEPAVTALLQQLAPETVPAVLDSGQFRTPRGSRHASWMLTERYPVAEPNQASTAERVLLALAALQARAARREAELRRVGVPRRGPLEVAADLHVLWEEAEAAGLTEAELERLPRLDAWLRLRLSAFAGVAPLVLVHGDLHLGNVLLTPALTAPGTRLVIFDWTDAALAWPGVDLLTLHGLSGEPQPGRLEGLRDAYLRAVRAALAAPEHERLLLGIEASLAEGLDLALVYHAVSYAHIVRSVPRRQQPFVGSSFLARAVRTLLAQLDEHLGSDAGDGSGSQAPARR